MPVGDVLDRLLAPLLRRLEGLAVRALIRSARDSGNYQVFRADVGREGFKDVPRFGEFGLYGTPPDGSLGILVAIGADREGYAILATDSQEHRPKDRPKGEAGLYNSEGIVLRLGLDGVVRILGARKLEVDGDIVASGDVHAGFISLKNHKHTHGPAGGTTSGAIP